MSDQCAYMRAAYPTLNGADTCSQHRHEPRVFSLARALAAAFQDAPISNEKIAWFLDDADAVVDDFGPIDWHGWTVTGSEPSASDYGLNKVIWINGAEYVLPESDYEPAVPVKRSEWESWHDDYEEAIA